MPTATHNSSLATWPCTWIAILVCVSVALSLGLACAVPFAALATIAALTLGRRDAVLLIGLAWLANQAVGFGLLQYPWTADTFAWGLVLLAVSVLATLGAGLCATRFEALPRSAVGLLAFLSAFGTYEGLLFLVTLSVAGGMEAYEADVVARILVLNATIFVVLLAASRLRVPRGREVPAPLRSGA